jgi:hypothetical protein
MKDMLPNTIEFFANELVVNQEDLRPIPCKLNIPDWYKELEHTVQEKTIKGCMPFLDTLTTGYLLKIPIDVHIAHNVLKEDHKASIWEAADNHLPADSKEYINIDSKESNSSHPIRQLGEKCPFVKKNKNFPFRKILNPWIIKTPPGYSCLFLPPLNNSDDRFSIIPGIVDTDKYILEVNFPIVFNGDKYPILETTIKKGTPYVQVIPFKRDAWKSKIKVKDKKEVRQERFNFMSTIFHNYKNAWWSKKSWK